MANSSSANVLDMGAYERTFQPIVDMDKYAQVMGYIEREETPPVHLINGMIESYEGLTRLKEFTQGVDFDEHIEKLHEEGLDLQFDVDTVAGFIEDLKDFRKNAGPSVPIAVNISWRTISNSKSANDLADIIEVAHDAGVDLSQLRLEITEKFLPEDKKVMGIAMRKINACGVEFKLDDVGAGIYKDKEYVGAQFIKDMHAMNIKGIKLDRGEVVNPIMGVKDDKVNKGQLIKIKPNPAVEFYAQRIIEECGTKDPPMNVVAEGIENIETLNKMRELGVGCGQGFLFGRAALEPIRGIDLYHQMKNEFKKSMELERENEPALKAGSPGGSELGR
ncbi:EAL domain-containing protein [Neptuniibacter sp. QD37_11]|uniref:EAL domain-containing protein n=1 Tax=Neptuniibacter sp. QD37_11 TaxID=3398209 RepID=UPI0039F4E00E